MKKLLLATALCALAAPAYAKTCGSATGVDAASPSDAALFNFYDASCSSDNQANDGDDVKAFLDSASANINGPNIDFSLTKNTSVLGDQNTVFKDLSAAPDSQGFTDGNGFANIKSTGDALQSFEIDPIDGSNLGGKVFNGFDGILFRGQLADLPAPAAAAPAAGGSKKADLATVTIVVNLSDGTSVTDVIQNLALNKDIGVLGFDEIGALPAGLSILSVDVSTDAAHSFDQVKQVEFSVEGAVGSTVPEPGTWAMMISGFVLMGLFGWRKARTARYAL